MQTEMDETIYIRMDGELAKILEKIDPGKYSKYMVYKDGWPTIYLHINKALYRTLQAALMFWKELSGTLLGFELNPYDRCVANKTMNGKQCTILWHVDDIKISHVEAGVMTKIIEDLNKKYGTFTPLSVKRGKLHDYIGMTLEYSNQGKCIVTMDDYILESIDEAPEDMDGLAETPASKHLFAVNSDAEKLPRDVADTFYSLTARLLFLAKRARPYIQTAVACLCTRVKDSNVDDYKKPTRVIKYLRKYPKLPLILEERK